MVHNVLKTLTDELFQVSNPVIKLKLTAASGSFGMIKMQYCLVLDIAS
jgi:hypothetical protein